MSTFVERRCFDEAAQTAFADLSGDRNPRHLDALAARRSPAGGRIVYGMLLVLWALDALAAARALRAPVRELSVVFRKFVPLGSDVELYVEQLDGAVRATLYAGGLLTTTMAIGFAGVEPAAAPAPLSDRAVALPSEADAGISAETRSRGGRLPPPNRAGTTAFSHAAQSIGAERVAALAQVSAIVGMLAPGRNAIFSECRLTLCAADGSGVSFAVERVDERFGLVELALAGAGLCGTARAFDAPGPVSTARLEDVRGSVNPSEFAGTTALIAGGSRGLGALTALVLAAGGARVAITYVAGEADAAAIAAEIGPGARVLRYDVREDAGEQLAGLDWDVDQLYYFASPPIFRQKPDGFIADRFREFCDVYIDGFARLYSAVRAKATRGLTVFYPSSTAIEERPRNLTEYAMAKAAGEVLCADIPRFDPGTHILVRRLPRVDTDQTASVIAVPSEPILEVVLSFVRSMCGETSGASGGEERASRTNDAG